MNAFKKWADDFLGWTYRGSARNNAEKGWRAALEEVLEQIDVSEPKLINSINTVESIVDWIKEELGEQNESI